MRGLVALLVAAALTLFPSAVLQAQSSGGTWTTEAPMPTARIGLAVATASNGKLYAIGGSNGSGSIVYLATVEEYDPATNTWATRAPMPTPRSVLGVVAAANGKLYAIGGQTTGSIILATVEEYDPTTDTWATKAPMPTPRAAFGVAAAPIGKVYAIGGGNAGSVVFSTVEEYDPALDTWTTKAPMPTPRISLSAALAPNGKVYAIGGLTYPFTFFSTVEAYDPATNTWSTGAPMPTARASLGLATAANGKLYAIGGQAPVGSSGAGPITTVEAYDPATNAWIAKTAMPTARAAFGVGPAASGKVYAIGGAGTGPYLSTVEEFDPEGGIDLAISQTDSPDPVAIGGILTYIVVARNNGPASATGVTLTDTLPAGVTFISASASQGACSGTTTLTCALGSLASGASATVTISVKSTAAGVLTDTASVAGNETDPVSANNTSVEGTTVLTTADLSRLTVAVEGQGHVTSSPAGINCHPSSCVANYGPGASVSLTATAATGWRFDHWERACQGQATTCTLTLGSDLLVKAVFVRAP